jgi:hypothetical protein
MEPELVLFVTQLHQLVLPVPEPSIALQDTECSTTSVLLAEVWPLDVLEPVFKTVSSTALPEFVPPALQFLEVL